MRVGGRALGFVVLLVTIMVAIFAVQYTRSLEAQRTQSVNQLTGLPQYEHCAYDDPSLCPQAEDTIVLPDLTGGLLALVAILLGIYLVRSDRTSRGILSELQDRKQNLSTEERRTLILSVLTEDERRVVQAVEQQPGISQATLRLRADMSKAKLSTVLKGLEDRGILARDANGKTNAVHLKREW